MPADLKNDKNSQCTVVWLVLFLVMSIIAMAAGAAAFGFTVNPRPGAWWPIFLGLIALVLGGLHLIRGDSSKGDKDPIRVAFIVIGTFAVLLFLIGGIIDGSYGALANGSSQCFPYDASNTNRTMCCALRDPAITTPASTTACQAPATTNNKCLCCAFDKDVSSSVWTVKGDCTKINQVFAGTLGASCGFNFISAIFLIVALSITCCKCCGPSSYDVEANRASNVTGVAVSAYPARSKI